MRGRGFMVVHVANDELYKFGKDKPRVPLLPDLELTREEIDEVENAESDGEAGHVEAEVKGAGSEGPGKGGDPEKDDKTEEVADVVHLDSSSPVAEENHLTEIVESTKETDGGEAAEEERESLSGLIADILLGNNNEDDDTNDMATLDAGFASVDAAESSTPTENVESAVSMDDRLRYYFKVALRFHLRPSTDLPATPQEVYKAMQSACPEENLLDFRKSSFKKPLKFFQEMQTQGEWVLRPFSKVLCATVHIAKVPVGRSLNQVCLFQDYSS